MSEAHVCDFQFEKNVMHIHVQHAAPGAQQATHRQAGKYTCTGSRSDRNTATDTNCTKKNISIKFRTDSPNKSIRDKNGGIDTRSSDVGN